MKWIIDKIINFNQDQLWNNGLPHFGFHDSKGRQYVANYDQDWIGSYDVNKLLWSAGPKLIEGSNFHIDIDLSRPTYITSGEDGTVLVVSSGNNKIYKVLPEKKMVSLFIDADVFGLKDIGNCEYDINGNIWVNEITGSRIWQFDTKGQPIHVLGNGEPGFQAEKVSYNKVRFNWVYDLRRGNDGNIYVLDSKNYAVRMIDVIRKEVSLIAGTGEGGYSGDGGNALRATFGANAEVKFDGPWSLSLDEKRNIFIGDTQNHVVRMVERSTNIIYTIAGNHKNNKSERNHPEEIDPLKLNLPLICSMDYYDGRLYIPEWDGDLIILRKDIP